MSEKLHGNMEDISAEIGYTATCALIDWFGGGNVHIPLDADPEHPLAKTLGLPAMRRLVKLYEGMIGNERLLWVPTGYQREMDRRDRMIALLFAHGIKTQEIVRATNLSERTVQQVRRRVEDLGILPLILRRTNPGVEEIKAALENPGGEKSQAKPRG